MKLIFKLLFLLLTFTLFANAENIVDINQKLEQAKKENKSLMFFYHVPDCPFCERMLDENFKDEKILKLINDNFIFIDIYTADKKAMFSKILKVHQKSLPN